MKTLFLYNSLIISLLLFSCQNDGTLIANEEEGIKIINPTGIPITYIVTDKEVEIDSKDKYVTGTVSITGGRLSSDLPSTEMKIRGRGNSTWLFHDKKPYQLKLADKGVFLDLPEDKKWIFLAEHSDKTLIRNKIAFELGYLSCLDWTPKSLYTDIYINDTYNGTYHVSQKVEESENRVVLGDTGYLIELDQYERLDPDDIYFRTYNFRNTHNREHFIFNIKEPEVSFSDIEFIYIKTLIDDFEKSLKSNQFRDTLIGYAKYIDVDSFIDYYLINEISKNQDAKDYSSIYLNVIPGEKIKMGPIWDFDLAFGNVDYSDCEYPTGFWIKDNAWYTRLFEDPAFVAKVKTRFNYYKSNQNLILEKIDSYATMLALAQNKNNTKWDVMGNYQWPNPVVLETYKEEVERLKNWYTERMNWLDSAISNL